MSGRFSLLRVVLPVFGLLIAAGLYAAASGATVCVDFKNTCVAGEASNAVGLRDAALVIGAAASVLLFLACRSAGGALRLDLSSDDVDVPRPVAAATRLAALLVGAVIVAVGLVLGTAGSLGLAVLIIGPVVGLAQLPSNLETRLVYGGSILLLLAAVLFGGPFLAIAFIVIGTFAMLTAALLSTASRGL